MTPTNPKFSGKSISKIHRKSKIHFTKFSSKQKPNFPKISTQTSQDSQANQSGLPKLFDSTKQEFSGKSISKKTSQHKPIKSPQQKLIEPPLKDKKKKTKTPKKSQKKNII